MCKDYNFWKKKYAFLWDKSSSREEKVKTIIEQETGMSVEYFGTGAGSTEFLDGKSVAKGVPDLHVVGTDIYIEVTGPFSDKVNAGEPLWFRPDKLNYAYAKRFETNEFFVNNFKGAGVWYVIHFDDDTIAYSEQAMAENTDYASKKTRIRGNTEHYREIKADTKYVSDGLQTLIDYIISYRDASKKDDVKNKIKSLRTKLGLTQKEFAKKYEIPLATVQDWEHGRRIPPTYVPKMCEKIQELEKKIAELEGD